MKSCCTRAGLADSLITQFGTNIVALQEVTGCVISSSEHDFQRPQYTCVSMQQHSFLAIGMKRQGNVNWKMDERIKRKKKSKNGKAILFACLLIVQLIKLTLTHTKHMLCGIVSHNRILYYHNYMQQKGTLCSPFSEVVSFTP